MEIVNLFIPVDFKLAEKMEVFMSYTYIIRPDFSILKQITYHIDTIMPG